MTVTIITRAEALAQGLKRYFTGRPCRRGHVAERNARGNCLACKAVDAEITAERNKTYRAAWYRRNRDRVLARDKEYARRRPEVIRAATLRWQAKNPEKAKMYASRWYAKPENAAAHRNRRRVLKENGGGTHTAADLKAILAVQDYRCAYCRADLRKRKKHLDHIMPLALGGSNDRANLQWTCAPCNLRKGAKHPVQFAQEIGLLL